MILLIPNSKHKTLSRWSCANAGRVHDILGSWWTSIVVKNESVILVPEKNAGEYNMQASLVAKRPVYGNAIWFKDIYDYK